MVSGRWRLPISCANVRKRPLLSGAAAAALPGGMNLVQPPGSGAVAGLTVADLAVSGLAVSGLQVYATLVEPRERVNLLAAWIPHFEVQVRPGRLASGAHLGDGVSCFDVLAFTD